MLNLLSRKFLIAVVSLLFHRTPTFQMSVALLILFASFSWHVRAQPFMSMSEMAAVIAEHEAKVEEETRQKLHDMKEAKKAGKKILPKTGLHLRVQSMYQRRIEDVKRRKAALTSDFNKLQQSGFSRAFVFSTNYNTVESILLFCSVMVVLSAIMFQSSRFNTDYYEYQKLSLAIYILIVIFASLIYYLTVFTIEVISACKKREVNKEKSKNAPVEEVSADNMHVNPMARRGVVEKDHETKDRVGAILQNPDPPTMEEWVMVQEYQRAMDRNLSDIVNNIMETERRMSVAADTAASNKPATPKKQRRKSKALNSMKLPGSPTSDDVWKEATDPNTGKTYYFNPKTQATSWTRPASMGSPASSAAESKEGSTTPKAPAGKWKETKDPNTGKTYYFNVETYVPSICVILMKSCYNCFCAVGSVMAVAGGKLLGNFRKARKSLAVLALTPLVVRTKPRLPQRLQLRQ